jgi:L-lactate dehydrogenase (cytochrome)/(S)-mandelate dehydrogenase
MAISLGADGIVVSNHGGAHLESVIAPIDCVRNIRKAIGPEAALVVDSGFRTGEDIAKGLAAGADFVLLGRAFAYSVAAAGPRKGPLRMVKILADELSRVLALVGHKTPASLTADDADELIRQCPV